MDKTLRPYDVTDTKQLERMESDNFPGDYDKWSIMNSGDYVSLHPPADDTCTLRWVQIPRDQFNAIVDWYMTPQPLSREDQTHG